MTIPLWGIAVLVTWTVFCVLLLLFVRLRLLAAGGDPREFGRPDEASLVWRLLRVQYNLVENVPLYVAVVVLIELRGATGFWIDSFASIYVAFRILHSLIHIAGWNPNLRLVCLVIQLVSLLVLTYFGVTYDPVPLEG